MILTKENILEEVSFEPALDQFQVNPHSIDLRVADWVTLPPLVRRNGPNQSNIEFGLNRVMVKSLEKVKLPGDVMAVVFPRSSTNRRGIQLDMTGVVDANYEGHLVLPLTNMTNEPINLMKGERIASLVFHRLEKQATLKLSKYHNSDGAYVSDKDDETKMLAGGQLFALKAKYPL